LTISSTDCVGFRVCSEQTAGSVPGHRRQAPASGHWILQGLREIKSGRHGRVVNLPSVASIREKTGLSQARFATLLGVSLRTLKDWEQGRRAPSGHAARRGVRLDIVDICARYLVFLHSPKQIKCAVPRFTSVCAQQAGVESNAFSRRHHATLAIELEQSSGKLVAGLRISQPSRLKSPLAQCNPLRRARPDTAR
jgi:putative transcriptional regulator